MKEAALNVIGMSCNHCVNTIKNRLGEVDGVDHVIVHLDKDSVDVIFDPKKATLEEIQETIKEQGYRVV